MQETEIVIRDATRDDRENLMQVLEEGFEGIYLWHAKKTLKDIEVVKVAMLNAELAGLVMLKDLDSQLGYVYYIAVARRFRGVGVGGKLLDYSLNYFSDRDKLEVFSSVEKDNEPSLRLFKSRDFRATSLQELSKRYGIVKANILRMKMLLVSGELLLAKELTSKLDSP
jgi:ribosomal protein S18 acetylase RimI-like enzyme